MEKNAKLVVFRQASSLALKKCREREEESLRLQEELKYINKQIEEKEEQIKLQHRQQMAGHGGGGSSGNKVSKAELKRFGAVVKEKIEVSS